MQQNSIVFLKHQDNFSYFFFILNYCDMPASCKNKRNTSTFIC